MTFWVLRMGHVVRYQPVLERSQTTITGPRVIGQLDSMKTCNQIRYRPILLRDIVLHCILIECRWWRSTFNLSRKRQKEGRALTIEFEYKLNIRSGRNSHF